MSLPDIADVTAFQARLGRSLAGADLARAAAAISDVSAWARSIAEQQWIDAPIGVPDDVVAVVLSAARRVFDNPQGFVYETMGPMSASRAAAVVTGSPFTAPEIAILKKARPKAGLWTLSTTRGEHDWETGFVADDRPGSDPIAWYASTDPGFTDADHYPGPP